MHLVSAATMDPSVQPVDRVLARIAKRTGYEPIAEQDRIGVWISDCPIRHAESNTLRTRVASDGRVLLLCRVGCSSNAIASALDLDVAELFPVPPDLIAKYREENQAPKTRWRLDELLEDEAIMRPPPPIVPRLAWSARSTLLAAREKAGKSTLTGYITACVSNGADFLGESCERGDVLVIGLEEFIGDTARRLRDFGADPTRVHLVDRFIGEPALRPSELREHLEAVKPVLAIVDSLTAYGHGQIQDDNNATQMAKVVQPLSDLVHELGPALILIHHATKATGRARGSTAITAGVDVVVEFEAPEDMQDTDPTLRRVRSVGRVPVPRQYDVRFNDEHPASYTLVEHGRVQPLDARILAFVRDHPSSSHTKVREGVGARDQEVAAMIRSMLDDGRLVNLGKPDRLKLIVPDTIQTRFDNGAGQ